MAPVKSLGLSFDLSLDCCLGLRLIIDCGLAERTLEETLSSATDNVKTNDLSSATDQVKADTLSSTKDIVITWTPENVVVNTLSSIKDNVITWTLERVSVIGGLLEAFKDST